LTKNNKNGLINIGEYMENFEKITIKTQRLKIRNFSKEDYYDLFEYLSDIDTYKFEPGKPITLNEAKKLCNERSKNNKFLAIQLENKMIGHIYFAQIEPKKLMTWEVGYIFNKKYQGKGYATESLKAILEYGFKNLNIHRIFANCSPKNIKSWKLLERVNMKREGKLRQNIFFNIGKNKKPIWLDTYEY
jgi:RimJ/RimL family protein N-acetyltransferase